VHSREALCRQQDEQHRPRSHHDDGHVESVRAAVESTFAKRPAAVAVCSGLFLDFGCFFVAMMNPLRIRSHVQLDADVPIEVGPRPRAIIARGMSETLKAVSERKMTAFDGLHIQNAARAATVKQRMGPVLVVLGCSAGKPPPSNCGKSSIASLALRPRPDLRLALGSIDLEVSNRPRPEQLARSRGTVRARFLFNGTLSGTSPFRQLSDAVGRGLRAFLV
jgi:hypothetical protein